MSGESKQCAWCGVEVYCLCRREVREEVYVCEESRIL